MPVTPSPPVIQSPVQSPRVVPPNPLPSYSTPGAGLPPTQHPNLIPPSSECPVKKPTIRKPYNIPDLPRRTEGVFRHYNTRFGQVIHRIAQNVSIERYAHHIVALATPPGKQQENNPPLTNLLKVQQLKFGHIRSPMYGVDFFPTE